MGLDIRLNQRLDLQLKLAPQIIQSIELLQLPAIDLLDVIQAELDTNEFLELGTQQDKAVDAASEAAKLADESSPAADTESDRERDEAIEQLERAEIWDDPETRRPRSQDPEAANAKLEAMQNTASAGPTLQEDLWDQYQLLDSDERDTVLAEHLIYNLDESGYLAVPLEEALASLVDQYTLSDAERVLSRIQRLEPRGVGARTREECLVLQLDPADPQYDLKRQLIEQHLEDLFKNRLPKIAKALDLTIDELKELCLELNGLTLRPGAARVEERNHYINPDLILEWDGHEYEIRLANEYVPELRLSLSYREALSSPDVTKEYREYVKRKVDSARAFILAVEKRQKTLVDVGRLIVEHQRDFFDYGPHYLKPLKMQDVADDLGVHVSTISRATSEKYIQTHRGIFCLKEFFTGGTQASDGTMESRESVKHKVKEIVDRENKQEPLSDDEIVDLLKKNCGLKVARRTVTKYRKALGIPSSRQRREF